MGIRTRSALLIGKALGSASRVLRFGGGSTLPGRVARRIDPAFVPSMVDGLPLGCVLITGTNGKTTTATLLARVLEGAGITPVHNRTGANLMAGLASALIKEADLSGTLTGSIGLFEVDEAALPDAVADTSPRLVLINNLFRDQLDRYGELDTLASRMKEAINTLKREATVALNADDPLVASVGRGLDQAVVYYGIDTDSCSSRWMQHAADSKHCSECGSPLSYEYHLFGHLGRYSCTTCGLARPEAQVAATELEVIGLEGTRCTIRHPGGSISLFIPLPGLYNVYNVLAAFAVGTALEIDVEIIKHAVEKFTAAFGRVEKVRVGDRDLLMILAKNPAGMGEVLRTLAGERVWKNIILALNDNIADGRDVSWIWDVDLEMLSGQLLEVVCSGIRAWDMALRVKYAELGQESLVTEPDLEKALDIGLEAVEPGDTLFVIPTYTAMLELRKILTERGLVTPFWEG